MTLDIRKLLTVREETRTEGGRPDGEPLVKAAALAVFTNPYANRPAAGELSEITNHGSELGDLLAGAAAAALGAEVQSYGKAALVGTEGELEHAVAAEVAEFGAAVRRAVGGRAWISSVSKRCAPGALVDVPLAYKDEIWVRSHYDAFTVGVPDGPLPGEIVVVLAVASRGRLHERVGGLTRDEVIGATAP